MRLPAIQGLIDRRILVNYRVDAEVAARCLPAPFRPKLFRGYAIAGVCLIRLKHLRPTFLPFRVGIGSENAAHRFAVEWDDDGKVREGVFIPRRDSSSRLNCLLGGRLVPGEHHHARFDVSETDEQLHVSLQSRDGATRMSVKGRVTSELPATSVFSSLEESSRFFEAGSVGYSATRDGGRFDGLELRCDGWSVQPLAVDEARSSFFDDQERFPSGSATLDHALLMRGVTHMWHGLDDLCCTKAP